MSGRLQAVLLTGAAANAGFATGLSTADSPSDGDSDLQMSLSKMCEEMFAALGVTAINRDVQNDARRDGRDGE